MRCSSDLVDYKKSSPGRQLKGLQLFPIETTKAGHQAGKLPQSFSVVPGRDTSCSPAALENDAEARDSYSLLPIYPRIFSKNRTLYPITLDSAEATPILREFQPN